ncbi:3-oxoacyl-[acyl-carrier-protein] reductase FabG [Ascidiaceihabitans donghaensis]|uniref:3-oxoacyl-[acyl-carrier-protein] reductase FabG n=1 Tax=Ascidiaceihabitans donghaensis TaxID=1510460 RepID=A0A2R8BD93_9RHOB|nr:SDR family NAD(P)-dependent oxidoreductase [Ascidiaceihabitans donghaensis]SPH21048.1 3-oxoacyl-[acyl-carrier-protein] reductase FabG [Ascidiaceihabitans donghaensis]
MTKTILITGATDGIGELTAKTLAAEGHTVLIHGRSAEKLEKAAEAIGGKTESYSADLTHFDQIHTMAADIRKAHDRLDVIINNAGVLKLRDTVTDDGYDARFVVNTFAPYVLTEALRPILAEDGRIVNLSSAAQAPIDLDALHGRKKLDHNPAYAQSKLALTIWTRELARTLPSGQIAVAVNPGSLLASKMVKEGYGIAGSDLQIGADVLREAAVGAAFADANGKYFDNDNGVFANPHPAALDAGHAAQVMQGIKDAVTKIG